MRWILIKLRFYIYYGDLLKSEPLLFAIASVFIVYWTLLGGVVEHFIASVFIVYWTLLGGVLLIIKK
jgi:hypothetical protein